MAGKNTISNAELSSAHHEVVSNGQPINWAKWNRMRSIRPDEAAKLIFCIDPIRWKGDQYAQGAIPQSLLEKIEHCQEYLSRIDENWTFARLAEELPDELPPGMLEVLQPPKVSPVAESSSGKASAPTNWVTKDALIAAFGCSPELFENGHKFAWLKEARIAGRGGKKSTPALYDPVAFANNLPSMTYAGNLTEKRAWEILKRSFPENYCDVSQFDPFGQE